MQISGEDVGDIFPRKVFYLPCSGKVKVKKLRSLHNDTIGQRESTYMQQIESAPTEGEIDLF